MYGYIYLTTNIINGKKYIGRHKATSFDNYYKGSGKIIKEAIIKYGRNNFKTEILEWCETKEDAYIKEDYWVNYFNAINDPNFYNLIPGGSGPLEVPDKTKTKLREAFLGDNNPAKRPEVRKKISDGKLGAKNPNYGKHWKMSEEQKIKLRQINLGRKMSKEACEKMSKAKKGKISPKRQETIINGIVYNSRTEAMKKLHISTRCLYRLLEKEKTKD